MGKPSWGHAQLPSAEHIGRVEATGGTETSKYPEEEKSTEISLVVASERETAQTHVCVSLKGVAACGVVGVVMSGPLDLARSYKSL